MPQPLAEDAFTPSVYVGGTSITPLLPPGRGSRTLLSSYAAGLCPEPDVPALPVASGEKSLLEDDI